MVGHSSKRTHDANHEPSRHGETNMAKRADAKYTTKGKRAIVRVGNASTIGYGKYQAEPGDFVAFDVPRESGDIDRRYGRVIGRVDAAGWDGADKNPIKGWIAVMMLGIELSFAHEMWVDPEWVKSCVSVTDQTLDFFRVFLSADPMDLMRMSEYGSLSTHGSNRMPPER